MYVFAYGRAWHGLGSTPHINIRVYIHTVHSIVYTVQSYMHAHTVITGYFFCRKKNEKCNVITILSTISWDRQANR